MAHTAKAEKTPTFRERFQPYVDKLGLQIHSTQIVHGHTVWVHKFNWPRANNGTRYDRFVFVEEFPDGSFAVYLDDGVLGIQEPIEKLRAMVKA